MYFTPRNKKCKSSLAKKSKKCQKHPVDRLPQLVVHQTCAKKVVWLTLAGPTLRVFKQPRRNFYLINWIADIDTLSRVTQKYCCPFVSIGKPIGWYWLLIDLCTFGYGTHGKDVCVEFLVRFSFREFRRI